LRSTALRSANTAVLTPIARARVASAVRVNAGVAVRTWRA
jgi:hypothetical protein